MILKILLCTHLPVLSVLFANKLEMSPKMGTIVMAHKDIDVDIVVVASQFN